MPKKEDLRTIKHTVRIYDDELLGYIEELNGTNLFTSKNQIIGRAVELGIPLLYKELFGKKITVDGSLAPDAYRDSSERILKELRGIKLDIEESFVTTNIMEILLASLYNIRLADIYGVAVTDDHIQSGELTILPKNLQEVKDEILKARFRKRK